MVVGSANQDLTSNSDVLPTLGETVMGKEFATACGGKGANQAVAAGMLGLAPGTLRILRSYVVSSKGKNTTTSSCRHPTDAV